MAVGEFLDPVTIDETKYNKCNWQNLFYSRQYCKINQNI